MIEQVLMLLLYLILSLLTYVALSIHFNLNCADLKFNLNKIKKTVIKFLVIIISFISITMTFDQMQKLSEFNDFGINPVNLIKTLILYYIAKIIKKLKMIIENPNSLLS